MPELPYLHRNPFSFVAFLLSLVAPWGPADCVVLSVVFAAVPFVLLSLLGFAFRLLVVAREKVTTAEEFTWIACAHASRGLETTVCSLFLFSEGDVSTT